MAADMREQTTSLFQVLGEGAKLSYEQMTEFFTRMELEIAPHMLCQFLDRDKDGFISAEDIFQTHAMVVSRSDEFLRAIFRFYTERTWYVFHTLFACMFGCLSDVNRWEYAGTLEKRSIHSNEL